LLKNYLLTNLNKLKKKFKILSIVLFKIATIYIFAIKLLLKQFVLIASNSNTKLLDKIFRSLLITIIIVSKINFYILRTICQIY